MKRYFSRKLIIYLLTFFLAVTIDWMIPRFMPGDPVQNMLSRANLRAEAAEVMRGYYTRAFGLDLPQAEIKIWTGDEEETPKELTIQIGAEDKDSKKMFVLNKRFPYVFKVDSAFLEEIPAKPEDWKSSLETEKKEEKD